MINIVKKYEAVETGRIFGFLEFNKKGKELWNYGKGVLGTVGGDERVKCWGGDRAKF